MSKNTWNPRGTHKTTVPDVFIRVTSTPGSGHHGYVEKRGVKLYETRPYPYGYDAQCYQDCAAWLADNDAHAT